MWSKIDHVVSQYFELKRCFLLKLTYVWYCTYGIPTYSKNIDKLQDSKQFLAFKSTNITYKNRHVVKN